MIQYNLRKEFSDGACLKSADLMCKWRKGQGEDQLPLGGSSVDVGKPGIQV